MAASEFPLVVAPLIRVAARFDSLICAAAALISRIPIAVIRYHPAFATTRTVCGTIAEAGVIVVLSRWEASLPVVGSADTDDNHSAVVKAVVNHLAAITSDEFLKFLEEG